MKQNIELMLFNGYGEQSKITVAATTTKHFAVHKLPVNASRPDDLSKYWTLTHLPTQATFLNLDQRRLINNKHSTMVALARHIENTIVCEILDSTEPTYDLKVALTVSIADFFIIRYQQWH